MENAIILGIIFFLSVWVLMLHMLHNRRGSRIADLERELLETKEKTSALEYIAKSPSLQEIKSVIGSPNLITFQILSEGAKEVPFTCRIKELSHLEGNSYSFVAVLSDIKVEGNLYYLENGIVAKHSFMRLSFRK